MPTRAVNVKDRINRHGKTSQLAQCRHQERAQKKAKSTQEESSTSIMNSLLREAFLMPAPSGILPMLARYRLCADNTNRYV